MTQSIEVSVLMTEQLTSMARRHGDRNFVVMDGVGHSYADAWDQVERVARGLRSLGTAPGDRVALLAPNCIEVLWAWLGSLAAGAADVPINVEARGGLLAYYLSDSRPTVIIGTPELLERVEPASLATAEAVVVITDTPTVSAGAAETRWLTFAELLELGGGEQPLPRLNPGDLASIVYTSGTTGPSKGVMWPHGFYPATAHVFLDWGNLDDGLSVYCAQPLYHLDARSAVLLALYAGGSVTLGRRFSASRFWDEIEQAAADVFVFIGTMIHVLHKQDHPGRPSGARPLLGLGSAIPGSLQDEFENKYSVTLLEGYAMTESPSITLQRDAGSRGTVGTESPLVEAVILDEEDLPVPDGVAGMMCVRPRHPHSMMLGYWQKPEATLEAFSNLWFHTGDIMVRRPTGAFEYIGRKKDSIRRRGENVSAWEVEEAALRHRHVLEAAAIGVPAEVGDEDVALLVVPVPGASIDVVELAETMAADLPRFAVPRFVEVVAALPKTPSERIAKGEVRARGLSSAAVDLASQ